MKSKFSFTLVLLLLLAVLSPRAARADLGFWSAALVGTWRHPTNGDLYQFKSDATYTFTAGASAKRSGIAGSSGYWKIVQPTQKESGGSMEGPVALLIKRRKIVFTDERNNRRFPGRFSKEYRLVVNTVIVDDAEDENLYYIDGAKWKRVR